MSRTKYLSDTVGAIAGVAFCALLFLATASFDPLTKATDAELIESWTNSSNLRDNVISMYFMLASVPCFLLFLVTLRRRLAAVEEEAAPLSGFMFATGLCFAVALLVAGTARGVIAQSVKFGDEPLPGPDALRYLTAFSATTYALVAMPAIAITIAAASWLIVRSRALSVWLAWAGFAVAGVIGVATAFLVGLFTLPLMFLWVLAASFELWRTRAATASERPPETLMTRTGDAVTR
jgi:hypothetical protein